MTMLIRPVEHLLVVCDGSSASNRALAEGACIADEHEAQMSVVALAAYEERTASCCGGIGACAWNRIQRELAEADLFSAQLKLAGREPEPTFQIVPGTGPAGIRKAVSMLRCDLVLVPARGPMSGSLARRVRRRVSAEVIGVRAH